MKLPFKASCLFRCGCYREAAIKVLPSIRTNRRGWKWEEEEDEVDYLLRETPPFTSAVVVLPIKKQSKELCVCVLTHNPLLSDCVYLLWQMSREGKQFFVFLKEEKTTTPLPCSKRAIIITTLKRRRRRRRRGGTGVEREGAEHPTDGTAPKAKGFLLFVFFLQRERKENV